MTPNELQEIIDRGETLAVEFKSDKGGFSDDKIAEAVACLSNGGGGLLLIGVEDDGVITGARSRHGDNTDPLRLQAVISNKTVPPVVTDVETVMIHEKAIITVRVPSAPTVVGTSKGLYVRRGLGGDGKPGCLPFLAHEMLAERIERGETDFSLIAEPLATLDDLDPIEFDRMRRLAGASSGSVLASLADFELGRALGVLDGRPDVPVVRRGALLLFGRPESIRRFIPTHETAFQVMDGTAVKQNVFAHDPLLKSAEELFAQLQRYNEEEEIDIGLTRVAVPRIPPVAARELIANALVHRDYTVQGAVAIRLNEDELNITNPGGFPRGITLDNFLTNSRPRSRTLSEAFQRAGLVERVGRGINRVFEWSLRTGRTAPDYARSDSSQVAVSVAVGRADLALVRFIVEHDERSGRAFALEELQIVHALLDDPRLTLGELSNITQASDVATRSTLTRLIEGGIVESRGDGRGRRYTLTASSYRQLSTKAGYVRVRAFDSVQQEQMVLTYVRSHGSITRREAAELCSISSDAAKTLLVGMRTRGTLEMRGERRGARYELASQSD
ncbi:MULTISPECIES: RNA-binding domain-containing protein [Microbacterium]|uniref:RNA-binding domain-containing protein n=1 Tax=Microbacterium TaxID=33882 RepID=UPI00051A7DE6|nr:RNA-binding domain-containing protein [Microbacterium profundi]